MNKSLWLRVTEGEEKMGTAISEVILAENFPKLMKDMKPQIQDSLQTQAG